MRAGTWMTTLHIAKQREVKAKTKNKWHKMEAFLNPESRSSISEPFFQSKTT